MIKLKPTVVIAAAFGLCAGLGASVAQADEPLKIGVITTLSGPQPSLASNCATALRSR